MSIKSYAENGATYYQVSVSARGTKDKSIRVQKQKAGISTLALAKKAEKELKDQVLREVIAKESAEAAWGSLVSEWELALRDGDGISKAVGKTTAEDYVQVIHTHAQLWWKRPATDITRGDVRAAYQEIENQGLSKSVADKLRSAINAVFTWAVDTGKLRGAVQSPALGLSTRQGREEEKRPEILTLSEIRRLLETARATEHSWYPVWAMALLTGMRAGELCALRWEDVDLENKLIHVRRSSNKRLGQEGPTKGRYWRDVPVSTELETLLLELRAYQQGVHVLPRIRELLTGEQAQILRDFCKGVGLPSVRFHTLRACFATQLLGANVAVPTVMRIGGWKSLKTMQRYIRLSGVEVQGATEGLKVLPPRDAVKVVNLFGQGNLG